MNSIWKDYYWVTCGNGSRIKVSPDLKGKIRGGTPPIYIDCPSAEILDDPNWRESSLKFWEEFNKVFSILEAKKILEILYGKESE